MAKAKSKSKPSQKKIISKYTTIVLLVVLGGILLCWLAREVSESERLIGGERDEHGCLIAAGYAYDEEIGACIRNWELDEGQRTAARQAANYIGLEYGMTIVSAEKGECTGCYTVKLSTPEQQKQIRMEYWKIRMQNFEDCANAGFPVMESYPRQCRCPTGIFSEEV